MAGAQPLSVSDIAAWFMLAGISSPNDRFGFLNILQVMDQAYMEWSMKRGKKKG